MFQNTDNQKEIAKVSQDLQVESTSPMTAIRQLMAYIETGNYSKFQLLLSTRQFPLNTKNSLLNKSFSLYSSNIVSQRKIINSLLLQGANPNIKIRPTSSSLLKSKDNTNAPSPLSLAIKMKDLELVKLLIERGAFISNKSNKAKNVLFFLFDNYKEEDKEIRQAIANEILSKDEEIINEKDPLTGRSLLMEAIINNCLPLIQLFIEKGANIADINQKDGNTIMHYGVMSGNIELIEMLLNYSKDKVCQLGYKNKNGETPLDIAMKRSSQTNIYRLLAEEFSKTMENDSNAVINNIFQESIALQGDSYPNRLEIPFSFKETLDDTSNEFNTNTTSGEEAFITNEDNSNTINSLISI